MSISVNDKRTEVVKVFLEEVKTTGGNHYEIRYNVKGNSASMGCGNCAVQSGSLSKVADDKFTVIDTAGNKRTFTIGTSRITEGGTGFTSAEVKKEKKSKETKKKKRGYWGFWKEKLGGLVWLLSPVLLVIWIPYLVLSIVWWILKKLLTITGIMFLLNVFGVSRD